MRWEALFADLEGQLAADERRELDDEVAERTRRERALVPLEARLAASVGSAVRLGLVDGRRLEGVLVDLGQGWVLLRAARTEREHVVHLAAVATVSGLALHAGPATTARRFGLGYALRALARDRATVAVSLLGGPAPVVGTIDAVGADHIDVAEHDEDLPRRRGNVTALTTVPFSALVTVEARR